MPGYVTVGYWRVSSDRQGRDGVSLDEQAAAGARWCREHDSELAQFVEDESAWTKRGARRPAEQQRVHFELAAAADPSEDLEALMRRATPMLVDTSRIWQGTPVAWKRRARR